jgi:PPOX class probable F420-dependent enzyme
MKSIDQFAKKQYLNLETFRKNGEGVKTPVWFAQDVDALYVITVATSGKAKRIRRNGTVNVVPCTVGGKPLGTWVAAQAREITETAEQQRVNRLLDKKYGLMKKMFDGQRARSGAEDTVLEIKLIG